MFLRACFFSSVTFPLLLLTRHNLVSTQINQVIALAALQGYCYWLDEKTGIERITINGDGRQPELQQRSLQITDIVAVSMPDIKTIRNHACSTNRLACSHFCIADHSTNRNQSCSCPHGLMLMEDQRNCGRLPACGPNHFTCAAPIYTLDQSTENKDCIPFSWRCDGQIDCPDKSDEAGCPTCRSDQFRCQSGECIEQNLVCDGTTHCADGHDEVNCCRRPQDFQCPSNKVRTICNSNSNFLNIFPIIMGFRSAFPLSSFAMDGTIVRIVLMNLKKCVVCKIAAPLPHQIRRQQ